MTWLILHAGALGDLVLTIHLALRLPGADRGLDLISRVNPGDLSTAHPPLRRRSSEGLGLHWLHTDGHDAPPPPLKSAIAGRRVLSLLGGPDSVVTDRLAELSPAALYAVDPQPDPASDRHIVHQWITRLEAQGPLIPKCVHHRPDERGLRLAEPSACGVSERDVGAGNRERGTGNGEQRTGAHCRHGSGTLAAGLGPILIHPGSGGRAKCWPLAGFLHVARSLRSIGYDMRLVLGPAELERWPAAERDALAREFSLLTAPDPDELARALAGARAYLGNDAGPTHLAALLGTPTVALFGPTRPTVWRPLGLRVTVLAGDPAAGPGWGISVAEVARAVGREL